MPLTPPAAPFNTVSSHLNPDKIMIVAGEPSGDLHGANLVAAIRNKQPEVSFCGIGGARLAAAGVEIGVAAETLSVVGVTEVLAKLPQIWHGLKIARQLLRERRPGLLVLIDFPDFNLRVAATAKELNIPVLYYISPQIWAWRPGRVRKIGNLVDHVAVILPFEKAFYDAYGVPATFVGHPLLDSRSDTEPDAWPSHSPHAPTPRSASRHTIGLLPGSRDTEIRRHIPVMLEATRALKQHLPQTRFLLSVAKEINRSTVEALADPYIRDTGLELVDGGVETIFQKSDLIVAASGTVTLEATIAAKPMVVIYKLSRMSFWLAQRLVRVKYASLPNLIAGKAVVPELLQEDATPERIAAEILRLLADTSALNGLELQMQAIRDQLGGAGASSRTADIALQLLDDHPVPPAKTIREDR